MTLTEILKKKEDAKEVEVEMIKEGNNYVAHEFIEEEDIGRCYKISHEFFKEILDAYKDEKITIDETWETFKEFFEYYHTV